ncbi:MAG: agmatinase [Dehalococcoidia bacterium]
MTTSDDRLYPADWQRGQRFSGIYSFMALPVSRDLSRADVAIVGVPFDTGVNHRPGARFGPRGIRQGSAQVRQHGGAGELWGPFRSLRVVDYGDLNIPPHYIDYAVQQIREGMEPIFAASVIPICLGGDHTISLPILRACAKQHGPVSLVHFDAHPDFWRGPEGRPYHHGTVFRLAADEGLISLQHSIQIGIRGTISAMVVQEARDAGINVITADQFYDMGVGRALEEIAQTVEGPVYISLDIDSVDPAFAPGTGTPEIAGLTSREIVQLVRGLRRLPIVAIDIVEVSPPYDQSEITCLLAANLVYEFLEVLAEGRAAAGLIRPVPDVAG